jgi:3-oxoacyl-[acyl-carrier protein] reductase
MGELSGKVAIVTGASKGIGAAIARAFANAGAAVAVNYASSKADADRVVGDIAKAGGKAIAIQADVAKRADVERLFAETKAKLGKPNILVNNAGVYRFGPLESVTEQDFHRHFDTNVLGAILAIQEAVKAFDGAGGSVINISTIGSTQSTPSRANLPSSLRRACMQRGFVHLFNRIKRRARMSTCPTCERSSPRQCSNPSLGNRCLPH